MWWVSPSLAHGFITRPIPRAPFTGVQYLGDASTTTNETTSTWSGAVIGDPHPDRIIILAIYQGVNGDVTDAQVNNQPFYFKNRLNEFAITAHRVPHETTATISVSATSSLRKAIGGYVAYPLNPIPLGFGSASATTTNDAVISNIKAQVNGGLVYSGGQNATLGTFTTVWSGADAVVEDIDLQLEATASYTFGHINFTGSTDQSSLTLQESTSGTKRLCAATWGPARGY